MKNQRMIVALLVVIILLLGTIVALLASQQMGQVGKDQGTATVAAFSTQQLDILRKCERENPSVNSLGTLDLGPVAKCARDNGYILPTFEGQATPVR